MKLHRRTWFRVTAGLLGASFLGTLGYNVSRDRVHVGIIGAGIRGSELARIIRLAGYFYWRYGTVVAVCDVDAARGRKLIDDNFPEATFFSDYRKLLRHPLLEAVIIATPDHWHIPMALDALAANKAIFLEKPVSHTINQGYTFLDKLKQNPKPVLVGTSQRSDTAFRLAAELVRNGRLGTVKQAIITIPIKPPTLAEKLDEQVPMDLDWKGWLGTSPLVPFSQSRLKDWRSYWQYGGGESTNFGTHHLDIVLWALGEENTEPVEVSSKLTSPWSNSKEKLNPLAPQEWEVMLKYPSGLSVLMKTQAMPQAGSIQFIGNQSSLYIDRERIEGLAYEELATNPFPQDVIRLHPSATKSPRNTLQHILHFWDCVRGASTPLSDYESACHVAVACHLVNISLRTGQTIKWDAAARRIVDNPFANLMLEEPF